jgi:hypothetical protein
MGYSRPLAVLGSSLTEYQIYLLRKLVPESIQLCFDKKSISEEVSRELRKNLTSVQRWDIVNDWEQFSGDPEDLFQKLLKENDQYFSLIEEGIKRFIKEFNNG